MIIFFAVATRGSDDNGEKTGALAKPSTSPTSTAHATHDVEDKTPEASPPAAETPAQKSTPSKKSTPPKKTETSIDAAAMEAAFENALGGESIKSMCDAAYTHWSCLYDGVEAGPSYLRVNLTTDGGITDTKSMAKTAGTHWLNFLACTYPDLDTIVVRVNGIDHNVFRSSTNAGLIKC